MSEHLSTNYPQSSATPSPSLENSQVRDEPRIESVELYCATHGKYTGYHHTGMTMQVQQECPRCVDAGYAKQDAERRRSAEQQMRARKLKEILAIAGIPARFATKTLDDYQAPEYAQRVALTICKKFAGTWPEQHRKGGSLVLVGGPGTGKTHLACAIANVIMPDHLATVAFGSVSDIMREIRSTYGNKTDRTEIQALADLVKPDLLIIDEVGASSGSEHEVQMLFDIIDKRYRNLRPTIVISNLNEEKLEQFLGHRVMDRFRETGSIVAFTWESHRGKQVQA